MKTIRAAIVGCGSIAQTHAAAIAAIDGATLTAVADILPQRAYALAAETGAHPYASLEELLAAEEFDVLHVCTPHHLHVPQILSGLEHGVAVFSEKPPAIDREQWQKLAKLDSPRLGFCFQNRYNPENLFIRELVNSFQAGAIVGGRGLVTWSRQAPYYTDSGWRGAIATEGGGALINQSIHTLDLLIWILGRPQSLYATAANHHLKGVIEVEDTLEVMLDYGQQRRALFYASTAYVTDAPVLFEIVCERVTVRAEGSTVTATWKDGRVETTRFAPRRAVGKDYWGASHELCIEDFYDAVRSNRAYSNDLASVADTVDTMLKIYETVR